VVTFGRVLREAGLEVGPGRIIGEQQRGDAVELERRAEIGPDDGHRRVDAGDATLGEPRGDTLDVARCDRRTDHHGRARVQSVGEPVAAEQHVVALHGIDNGDDGKSAAARQR